MLLRKRAWDLMQDDYPRVGEGAAMFDVLRAVRGEKGGDASIGAVLVVTGGGSLCGAVTRQSLLKLLERHVFKGSGLDGTQGADWDEAFDRARMAVGEMPLDEVLRRDVPCVRPNDPLLLVVEEFLKGSWDFVAVKEGERVLGVVSKSVVFQEVSRDMLGPRE